MSVEKCMELANKEHSQFYIIWDGKRVDLEIQNSQFKQEFYWVAKHPEHPEMNLLFFLGESDNFKQWNINSNMT
ncbi:MAG: hypothetical protein ACQETE_01725 [Bacteroidota bacterium]